MRPYSDRLWRDYCFYNSLCRTQRICRTVSRGRQPSDTHSGIYLFNKHKQGRVKDKETQGSLLLEVWVFSSGRNWNPFKPVKSDRNGKMVILSSSNSESTTLIQVWRLASHFWASLGCLCSSSGICLSHITSILVAFSCTQSRLAHRFSIYCPWLTENCRLSFNSNS
jgi:hypothetical protein